MVAPRGSPNNSPRKKSTTLQHLFELDSDAAVEARPAAANGGGATPLSPALQSETDELLHIINCCAHVFTFTDPDESPSELDLKRHKLSHLLSLVRGSRATWPGHVLSPLVSMLSANLFRPLPPPPAYLAPPASPDDESPVMAFVPAWPHLHVVYDLLGALVAGCDEAVLRAHVDRAFLSGLLSLFQSEDPRERDRLKIVYHQMYARFACHRRFMRRAMRNELLRVVYETERHAGVGELLEIWASLIDGFAVPLKEEHKVFLARVLLPLHKPKGMHVYHKQLAYCVCQLVTKAPELGDVAVRGILRCWPSTNSQKEVLFIGELEDLVESADDGDQLGKLAVPVCSRIARCLNSCNCHVAERALYVWSNHQFVRMASQSMELVLPAVVEAIEDNVRSHWSESVRQLTLGVKQILEETWPWLYAKCLQDLRRRESTAGEEEMSRRAKWDRLEMAAAPPDS